MASPSFAAPTDDLLSAMPLDLPSRLAGNRIAVAAVSSVIAEARAALKEAEEWARAAAGPIGEFATNGQRIQAFSETRERLMATVGASDLEAAIEAATAATEAT